MGMSRFRARNHPQQIALGGADDSIDDRGTPPEWFAELDRRFRFTVDVAASERNRKLPRFFDKAANGLEQSWACERVWCNPPFSAIGPWARKAWRSGAAVVVMCVPANRTEQDWWHDLVEPFRDRPGSPLRVEFIRRRQRFIRADSAGVLPNDRPPFGIALLIWEWPANVSTQGDGHAVEASS